MQPPVTQFGPYNGGPPQPVSTGSASVYPAVVAIPMRAISVPTAIEYYRHRQSIVVGGLQVIIGVACIIFNAVSLGLGLEAASVDYVGHGFWIGLLFIATGALGIATSRRRSKCTVIAFMTMCIISAAFTTILLSLGILGVWSTSFRSGYSCSSGSSSGYGYSYAYYYRPPCYSFKVVIAMEVCLAIAGFVTAIISIWGATICCRSGICCCSDPKHAVVIPSNYCASNGQISQQQGIQVFYRNEPNTMPYQQGVIVPPLSYQTSFPGSGWSRPEQMTVIGATGVSSTHVDSNPPPYVSDFPPLQREKY